MSAVGPVRPVGPVRAPEGAPVVQAAAAEALRGPPGGKQAGRKREHTMPC